jgi:hypothetical protein
MPALNLSDLDQIAQIRLRSEYYKASMVIPIIFKLQKNFNKNINSYGLKNQITFYLDAIDPTGYNYIDIDSLTVALIDLGYKARLENSNSKNNNPNYIFNVKT